jgi:hypothetical protein
VIVACGAALVLRRIRAGQHAEAPAAPGGTGDEFEGPETRRPGEPLSAGAYRQPARGPGR